MQRVVTGPGRWLAALLAIVASATPAVARAQTGSVHGVVVASLSGEPLGYSDVTVLSTGDKRFTGASGAFTLADVPAGAVQILVRHLGYVPQTVTVHVGSDSTATVRVTLTVLALQLAAVRVQERWSCTSPGAPRPATDSALANVFGQLEDNADRYGLLMGQYPFRSTYEITNARRLASWVDASVSRVTTEVVSDRRWSYAPGEVIRQRTIAGALINIPTLDVFADQRFIGAHCFRYAGVEAADADSLLRVDFLVADKVQGPDLDGSMYLDPHTFLLRRSRLVLTHANEVLTHADSAVVVTRFDELMPGVPVVADIVSTVFLVPARHPDESTALATQEERRRLTVKFTHAAPDKFSTAEVQPIVEPYSMRPPAAARLLGVYDSATGTPLADVMVSDSITRRSNLTSSTGTVKLDFISRQGGVLTLTKTGYATLALRVSAAPGDTLPLTIVMERR